jgi:hypothetical protein
MIDIDLSEQISLILKIGKKNRIKFSKLNFQQVLSKIIIALPRQRSIIPINYLKRFFEANNL